MYVLPNVLRQHSSIFPLEDKVTRGLARCVKHDPSKPKRPWLLSRCRARQPIHSRTYTYTHKQEHMEVIDKGRVRPCRPFRAAPECRQLN